MKFNDHGAGVQTFYLRRRGQKWSYREHIFLRSLMYCCWSIWYSGDHKTSYDSLVSFQLSGFNFFFLNWLLLIQQLSKPREKISFSNWISNWIKKLFKQITYRQIIFIFQKKKLILIQWACSSSFELRNRNFQFHLFGYDQRHVLWFWPKVNCSKLSVFFELLSRKG